jgi:quercetin dioxygenase-like cupin family protein
MEKKLPFDEHTLDNRKIRIFNENIDSEELKWHRDREERLIEVISGNGWKLQLDNELPKELNPGEKYIIPEGVYHRVIKGNTNLKIVVTFL